MPSLPFTRTLISTGALSLLQTIRGGPLLQLLLLLCMWLFSLIGFLMSLRLKAELEECLGEIQALSTFVEPQRALRLQLYGSLAPSR